MSGFESLCEKEFGRSALWASTKSLRGDPAERLAHLMSFLTKLHSVNGVSASEFRYELSACRVGMEKKARLSSKKADKTNRAVARIKTNFKIVRRNISAIPREYNQDKKSGKVMDWVAEQIENELAFLESRLKDYRKSLKRGRNKLQERTTFREVSSLIIFYRRLLGRAQTKGLPVKSLIENLKSTLPANALLKFARLSKQDYAIALLVLYTCQCFWPNYGISPHRIAELVRTSSRK